MSKILSLEEIRERLGVVPTDPTKNLQCPNSENTYENCANMSVFLEDNTEQENPS